MAGALRLLIVACVVLTKADEDLRDFEFENDPDEVMIAQESRHYQTIVKPPVRIIKPTGVTNSHRPQYNLDSLETGDFQEIFDTKPTTNLVKNYKSSNYIRAKENMVKEAIIKANERKDHVGKFAQIVPIIRAMSSSQRIALASLVASQVTTPPGRAPLTLGQVRSLFSNTDNTTEQMLPILLDMANMVRKATRPGKETREVRYPQLLRRYKENRDTHEQAYRSSENMKNKTPAHNQGNIKNTFNKQVNLDDKLTALRRSFIEDDLDDLDDDPFDIGVEAAPLVRPRILLKNITLTNNKTNAISKKNNSNKNLTRTSSTTEYEATSTMTRKPGNQSRTDNSSLDLMADSTNQTLAQDLPVAEKLRALNRYIDRKGSLIRRGTYPPKPYTQSVTRRTTAEPTVGPISRRRPAPARKLPVPAADQSKCELFTNTLCLHAEDYPTEAIVQSIRRNKAAAGALLADYKDPGDGAVDGVSADQEEKYTADHYLVSNRRGDTANRDFAGAGEAGFMCPSTVKYARPQRARATSGQWKYIVNTGEHTQTLRLEKCLKPKDSCTYLTDNFKSKCVQVYNYHRLLTWDQQNGLHMDIFKVPTCCSCHIEGYSVNFPPVGHRIHETSSEHFPGEDLSSEHGNHAFEAVQSTIQRPISKIPPFSISKPESFPPFADNNQNSIPTVTFNKVKHTEPDDSISQSNPMDSYGNTYFPDSFNQASSVRNVRRPSAVKSPASNLDSVTLPSYLEPPTLSASSSFTYINEPPGKFKTSSQFKRGAFRPNRRPIRKKISGPEDLISSGSSAIESLAGSNLGSVEIINDFIDEPQIGQAVAINPPVRATIGPKLHSVTEQTSTVKSQEQRVVNENFTSNDKRINYNYHPIIDFFGENEKDMEDSSIDREDIEASFVPSVESEWKPINNPPPRSTISSNSLGRKKQIKLN